MQGLVGDRFIWHQMRWDVPDWVRSCHLCQANKIHQHNHSSSWHIPVPDKPFVDVHIDLVGLLPASHDFTHILTVIDRFTQCPEAVLLASTTASACTAAFLALDVSVRGALPPHLGMGPSIHFRLLEQTGLYTRHRPPPHLIIPSLKQWGGDVAAKHPEVSPLLSSVFTFLDKINFPGSSLASKRVSRITLDVLRPTWSPIKSHSSQGSCSSDHNQEAPPPP